MDEALPTRQPSTRQLAIIAVAVVLFFAAAAFLVWRHFTQLGAQMNDLSRQVEGLSAQAEGLSAQAAASEARAVEAEARAEQAQNAAGEAADRAAEALGREQQGAAEARQALAARQTAEERERLAADERERAEILAQLAERAQVAAEQKQAEAERRSEEAFEEAQTAQLEARQARAETEKVQQRLEQELDRLERALGRIAATRRTALGLVMTLDSKQIEFDFDKADLRPANREVLSRIAGVLLTFRDYAIQVFGHTDDVGTQEYNQTLSQRRAEAVRDYLVESGVDPAVMSTMGLGKSSPLVEEKDPESRQRNRRVELAIVFSEGEFEAKPEE